MGYIALSKQNTQRMDCTLSLRATLWLVIFVLMLIRYTGTDTTWDSTLHINGASNSTAEVIASIKVSNLLGIIAIFIHCLLAVPIVVYIWYGTVFKPSTVTSVILDTLLSWTLLIQVAVTGSDLSLYSTGWVTYMLVGLDLGISFCVVLFQSIIRNATFEELPTHLQLDDKGMVTLREQFVDDEDEGRSSA